MSFRDARPLVFADAVETDLADPDLPQGQVHGRTVPGDARVGPAGHLGRDRLEHRLVLAGVPVSLVDDVIDTGLVEGEHRVALELMVDADIPVIGEDFLGGTVGGGGQEGDRLHEEVYGGIQLVQLAVDGHVRADDDVRAQGLGDIDGEVVPHAAVQEHFAFLAHGAEVEWDGHRGAEGVRDAS